MNDTRENKHSIVPTDLQIENLILAEWYASTMQKKVDDKFNQKGWFVCKKDKTHVYNQIGFGNPILLNSGFLWLKRAIFSLIAECIREIIAHILSGVRIIRPLINYWLDLIRNFKMQVQLFR